ncbi:MAG TPA: hypothetical protein VFP99_03565 [Chthoniobacterales bacterium]|nr:hypothetical protein [Chthoniobacterales bacterium]
MVLSFAAAVFCFGATKTAAPAASPAAAKTAKASAPKKEAAKVAAMNPHMGTWKLNEAKSNIPAGMNKNTTVVYTEMKGKMNVTVTGVDKDGKPTHGVWVGTADGKAYKTKGNLAWDAAAYKVVNDHTYAITTMKGGKVFSNGKSTVSADGKTRTVATEGTGADGKKFKSKAVFDKG